MMRWMMLVGEPLLSGANMSNTFGIGDRVVVVHLSSLKKHNEYEDDDCTRGTVKDVKGDKYLVHLDSTWQKPRTQEFSGAQLITEEEANKKLSELEQEYEAWAGPIRAKVEEAAKLLLEAEELAQKQDRSLAEEFTPLAESLISAMSDIGWSTSSLSC